MRSWENVSRAYIAPKEVAAVMEPSPLETVKVYETSVSSWEGKSKIHTARE